MNKGKLIYLAHPFGGEDSNKKAVDKIMKNIVIDDRNNTYLSPLHNFSTVYFADEYAKGLKICLEMLNRCDVLVLCGDWQTSKGCIGEWSFALAKGMPIYTWEGWRKQLIVEERKNIVKIETNLVSLTGR